MEGSREFLEQARHHQLHTGNFRGLLHILIGRRIAREDGTLLSNGMSWRQLAELLKLLRWDKDCVRELGLDPDDLPPRDRQRYWYSAILAAQVDSPDAIASASRLVSKFAKIGFVVT
ncbi:MAG: hypothetical protein K8T89_07905 [Planctomycetes bacterium]|nr:hypothetical protein [Planctomycetota bacterium]